MAFDTLERAAGAAGDGSAGSSGPSGSGQDVGAAAARCAMVSLFLGVHVRLSGMYLHVFTTAADFFVCVA